MITLHFDQRTSAIEFLEERLHEMSLGFKIKQKNKYTKVELRDGDQTFKGLKAINKYLDEIQGELKQWWYCDC